MTANRDHLVLVERQQMSRIDSKDTNITRERKEENVTYSESSN